MPCLRRATDVENYNPEDEFALDGDEAGWVATHADPSLPSKAAAENIPSIDDDDKNAGVDDDDIPDMNELEDVDDEVCDNSVACGACMASHWQPCNDQ